MKLLFMVLTSSQIQNIDTRQTVMSAQKSSSTPAVVRVTKSAAELTVPVVKSASALQQPLSADWFSEVRELRQKAEEYRYVCVCCVVPMLIGSEFCSTNLAWSLHLITFPTCR